MKFHSSVLTALLSMESVKYIAAEEVPASLHWSNPAKSTTIASQPGSACEIGNKYAWMKNSTVQLAQEDKSIYLRFKEIEKESSSWFVKKLKTAVNTVMGKVCPNHPNESSNTTETLDVVVDKATISKKTDFKCDLECNVINAGNDQCTDRISLSITTVGHVGRGLIYQLAGAEVHCILFQLKEVRDRNRALENENGEQKEVQDENRVPDAQTDASEHAPVPVKDTRVRKSHMDTNVSRPEKKSSERCRSKTNKKSAKGWSSSTLNKYRNSANTALQLADLLPRRQIRSKGPKEPHSVQEVKKELEKALEKSRSLTNGTKTVRRLLPIHTLAVQTERLS